MEGGPLTYALIEPEVFIAHMHLAGPNFLFALIYKVKLIASEVKALIIDAIRPHFINLAAIYSNSVVRASFTQDRFVAVAEQPAPKADATSRML